MCGFDTEGVETVVGLLHRSFNNLISVKDTGVAESVQDLCASLSPALSIMHSFPRLDTSPPTRVARVLDGSKSPATERPFFGDGSLGRRSSI